MPWRGQTLAVLAPVADLVNHRFLKGGGARLHPRPRRSAARLDGDTGRSAWGPGVADEDVVLELLAGSNYSRGQVCGPCAAGPAFCFASVVFVGLLATAAAVVISLRLDSALVEMFQIRVVSCRGMATHARREAEGKNGGEGLAVTRCRNHAFLDDRPEQEVFVSYGPKCNDELRLDYGFSSSDPSPPCSWGGHRSADARLDRGWAGSIEGISSFRS